jgi:uncharacterized membrane protein (Fun14 family)
MNIENIAPILTSSGFGMMGGFLMGFAIKKVMKVLAIIAGIFLSILAYFESQDIIYINWKNLVSVSENTSSQVVNVISEIQQSSSSSLDLAIPMGGSMTLGFILGFMKG